MRRAGWSVFALILHLMLAGPAEAQDALLEEVHTISAGAEPVEREVTITQTGRYQVILTDTSYAAPLVSAKLAIMRGNTVVGTAAISSATTSIAGISLDATPGKYVFRIVGITDGASSGSAVVQISRANETSLWFDIPALFSPATEVAASNWTAFDLGFSPVTSGTYEVTLSDLAVPHTLSSLTLSVREFGGAQILTMPAAGSATFTAQVGTYYLIEGVGESSSSVNAGLLTLRVRQVGSSVNVRDRIVPVGRIEFVGFVTPTADAHVFSLNDLQFPAALAEKSAVLLLRDGTPAAISTGAPVPFTASGAEYIMYSVARAAQGSSGAYSVDVKTSNGAALFSKVKLVDGGATNASRVYGFDVDIPTAGAYRMQIEDFAFPGTLAGMQLAAAQGGTPLLGQRNGAGIVELQSVSAGKLFVLAAAQPVHSSGGVLGLEVRPSAGGQPVFETTQGVGNLFQARRFTVTRAASYRLALTDIGFPAPYGAFGAVVTRGTVAIAGSAFNSPNVDFNATPGDYVANFVVAPNGPERAATYGLGVVERPPAPSVSLTANPAQVTVGTTATLTWSSTNASTCVASSGWTGNKAASGTEDTAVLSSTTVFTLSCTGNGGTASATATVAAVSDSRGGGGALDWLALIALASASAAYVGRSRRTFVAKAL
jgi:hypothetical protein